MGSLVTGMKLAFKDINLKEQIMDPISLEFAVNLDSVQSAVCAQAADIPGPELKAVKFDCQGVRVPFHYPMSRVKDNSVYSRYQRNLTHCSHCTVTAKELFSALCSQPSQNPSAYWRYIKTKNVSSCGCVV